MAPVLSRLPCVHVLPVLGSPHAGEGEVVKMNSPEGIPFESDGFKGQFLLLHRPEFEDSSCAYARHLASKGRVFEFRVQGVFTKEPGDVFFAGEVRESVGLSWAMRTTLSWLMTVVYGVVLARGGWLHFNPEVVESPDGKTERPHLVWRLNLADTVIATPLGETPPPIGQSFLDSTAQHRGVKLDSEHTYTFVFHSDIVDFIRWELCNLPFGLCGPLDDYVGRQLVHMCVYRLHRREDGEENCETHSEENKEYFLRFDISRPKEARAEDSAARACRTVARQRRGERTPSSSSCFCGAVSLLGPWRRLAGGLRRKPSDLGVEGLDHLDPGFRKCLRRVRRTKYE